MFQFIVGENGCKMAACRKIRCLCQTRPWKITSTTTFIWGPINYSLSGELAIADFVVNPGFETDASSISFTKSSKRLAKN